VLCQNLWNRENRTNSKIAGLAGDERRQSGRRISIIVIADIQFPSCRVRFWTAWPELQGAKNFILLYLRAVGQSRIERFRPRGRFGGHGTSLWKPKRLNLALVGLFSFDLCSFGRQSGPKLGRRNVANSIHQNGAE
jgi:hypothetical protein